MNFNHDLGLIDTLLTIDTTTPPPLGGLTDSLAIIGTGSLIIPSGTTLERPGTPQAAMFRFNQDTASLEFHDGTSWVSVSSSSGTVSSVTVTTSTGMTVSGGSTQTINSSGTFALSLNSELQGLSGLSSNGIVVRTGAGAYSSRTIQGTSGNIDVSNGSGASGDPTVDLAAVTQASSGSFVKVTLDGYGRVTGNTPVVASDVTSLVDSTYVNVSGDTMASGASLTFVGGEVLGLPSTPSTPGSAASKAYVDAMAAGLSWKMPVRAASTADVNVASAPTSIDNVTLTSGDRVLLKNQATMSENGIYIFNGAGNALTRSADFDQTSPINEVNNAAVFVTEGVANANIGYTQINNVATVGVDPIQFAQFAGVGTYSAGTGLTLTGNVFSLTSPVATTLGGTGLSSIGTADQVLSVNHTGTGLEYKTVSAGAGVSVTAAAGTLTIANTGVTSIAGTTNQIVASASTGAVTLSMPSAVTIGSLTLSGLTANSFLFSGASGLLTTTSAPTDGQLLVGSTGNAPVAATLTAGTGVSVTNGAGSITIANTGVTSITAGTGISVDASTGSVTITNTGVTSVDASGGTTGMSFTGGPVTSTGTLTLTGTLNVANGGTGLTSLGSANQVLGVDAAGAVAEYKTIAAGTGVSVVHTANTVTINNTGVTSVALSAPSIFTVSGSPVTSTGTLSFSLNTQSANTVFAGPSTGGAAAPTFRTLGYADLPIQLYVENPSTPTAPVATGANAIAIGNGSTATAIGGEAHGDGSKAAIFGQKAFANGSFASAGDAQHGVYVLRNVTTTNASTELFLDGATASQRIVLPSNSVFTFSIMIAGRRTDAVGGGAGYRVEGVIRKDTTSASTTIIGSVSKSVLGETNASWDVAVTADTTNGSLKVAVVGENAKTINWVATVLTTEVTN